MNFKSITFYILLISITPFLEAQIINLEQLNYKKLDSIINTSKSDSIRKIYAHEYLKKAKKDNEVIKIANGYNFLLEINSHSLVAVKYADSIITKNYLK